MRCFICNYSPISSPDNDLYITDIQTLNQIVPYNEIDDICLNCLDMIEDTYNELIEEDLEREKDETSSYSMS